MLAVESSGLYHEPGVFHFLRYALSLPEINFYTLYDLPVGLLFFPDLQRLGVCGSQLQVTASQQVHPENSTGLKSHKQRQRQAHI